MEHDLLRTSLIGTQKPIVKITVLAQPDDISLVPALLSLFETHLKSSQRFIFDLKQINMLTPSLVVALLEITAKCRRKGGQACIVNLSFDLQKQFESFNTLTFLFSCSDEEEAIEELTWDELETIVGKTPPAANLTPGKKQSIKIPSRVDALYRVCDFSTGIARDMGFSDNEISRLKIAVYEACLNVIEHAYHSDPDKIVEVQVDRFNDKIVITVIDHGEGFEEQDRNQFDIEEAASLRRTGGMGLHIINRSMDLVQYKRDAIRGNYLTMTKYLGDMENQG
jgi:anti-sigma regulatory factor (Ser/Thr protein kinase)/anti-anti-sigma regulatory factor